jgi:glucose-1-phosphate adenylyltransferase
VPGSPTADVSRHSLLALVLAGGEGGRLELLTDRRAKPALPYAGVFRLIDIPLTNCVHSAVSDVWVVQQFQPQSLLDHLSNGRPWDLDRTHGGLQVLQPHLGRPESGWYGGNADAIHRNGRMIRAFDPELILVLSADHVYRLDYRDVVDRHLATGAALTVVTTPVEPAEASSYGNLATDDEGRVTRFAYKPDEPVGELATTEIFLYDGRRLLDTLDELAEDAGDDGLSDFGDELVPRLVEEGTVWEHRLEGYWRDVGTPDRYWRAHMDLLEPEPAIDLDDPDWPILTRSVWRPGARLLAGSRADRALVSPGCRLEGAVERSVLGPGVVVERGARVADSVILGDAVIRRDATVQGAIVDERATVGAGARVGGEVGDAPAADELTLVAGGAAVPDGGRVERGARHGG